MLKNKQEQKIQYLFISFAFILISFLAYSFFSTSKTQNIEEIKVSKDKISEEEYKKDDTDIPLPIKKDIKSIEQNQTIQTIKKIQSKKTDKKPKYYEKKVSHNPNSFYTISLKNDTDIKLKKTKITRYILIKGTLTQDEKREHFSLSLAEHYERYINDIYIEVSFIKNPNKKFRCSLEFMPSFEIGSIYEIGIDLYDSDMSCYLKDIKKDKNQKFIDEFFKQSLSNF